LLERLTIQNRWGRNLFIAQLREVVDFLVKKKHKLFCLTNKLVNARKAFVDNGDCLVATALNRKALGLIDLRESVANLTGK
jgi:hypothetical protein